MSEVVEIKRPVSVWLAQIVLLLMILFSLYVMIEVVTYRQGHVVDRNFVLITACIVILSVLGIWGFISMMRKRNGGRILAAIVFVGMAGLLSFAVVNNSWVQSSGAERTVIFLFLLASTVLISLSAFLLLSRKVKMFFDPSLQLQVDESSAIFNSPPPPPRFDD